MLMQELIRECEKIAPPVPQQNRNFSLTPSIPTQLPARFQSWPPTPKQLKFYDGLVESKQMTDDQREEFRKGRAALTRKTISVAIQHLTGLPYMPRTANTAPVQPPIYRQVLPVQTPAQRSYQRYGVGPRPATVAPPMSQTVVKQGYYAIVDPLDKVLKFYQVRVPKHGHWAGYTFVNQVSGDNKLGVRDARERYRILVEIGKNATEALKRFGQEIGQCGHCRKQLTDAESRKFGIGPVCRKVLGL